MVFLVIAARHRRFAPGATHRCGTPQPSRATVSPIEMYIVHTTDMHTKRGAQDTARHTLPPAWLAAWLATWAGVKRPAGVNRGYHVSHDSIKRQPTR